MPIKFKNGWNTADNNNGATEKDVVKILQTALRTGDGDRGLLIALAEPSDKSDPVDIIKGIHQEGNNNKPHITALYSGGTWHINLVQTSIGGVAGYRVGMVTQWRESM